MSAEAVKQPTPYWPIGNQVYLHDRVLIQAPQLYHTAATMGCVRFRRVGITEKRQDHRPSRLPSRDRLSSLDCQLNTVLRIVSGLVPQTNSNSSGFTVRVLSILSQ